MRLLKSRFINVAVLLMLSAGVGYLALASYERAYGKRSPRIVLSARSLDLGAIPIDVDVERKFSISNHGNSPLVIAELAPTCGCTRVFLADPTIPAGEEAEARIVVRESALADVDRNAKIAITSNDPRAPKVTVPIRYRTYRRGINASPQQVSFGRVSRDQLPCEQEIRILSKDQVGNAQRVRLIATESDSFFSIAYEDQEPGGQVVRLTLTAESPSGDISSRLVFRDDVSKESLSVSVSGYVRGRFLAAPSALLLVAGREADSVPKRERIRIVCRESSARSGFTIEKCEVAPSLRGVIQSSVVEGSAGPEVWVWATNVQDREGIQVAYRISGSIKVTCVNKASDEAFHESVNIPIEVM
jgi:hypothetical protein